MKTTVASLSVQTGIDEVKPVIQKIMDNIRGIGICFELNPSSFCLMMEEALLNAMHHGNRWNPCRNVNVTIQLDETALYIVISDEGDGFSQLALAGRTDNTGKNGIRIIRKFCNPYWNDKGNTIYLKLPLPEERTPAGENADIEDRKHPDFRTVPVYSDV